MAPSLAKILVHAVFSTKERRPFLRDKALRDQLHRYMGGILVPLQCQPVIVGGVEDHVHFLCALSRISVIPHTTTLRGSDLEIPVRLPFLQPAAFLVQNPITIPAVKAERFLGRLTTQQLASV